MSPPNDDAGVLDYGDVAVERGLDAILNDRAVAEPLKKGDEEEEVLDKCEKKARGSTLIIIAGGWHYDSKADEIQAIGNDSWRPTTADFRAAAGSSARSASDKEDFLNLIAGKGRGSIRRVVFIGHGGVGGIHFSGDPSTGHGSSSLNMDGIANKLDFIKNSVRPKMNKNAKIDLVTCTNGADKNFMDAMANAFDRCIRGFDGLIEFRNPTVSNGTISDRGLTRVQGATNYKKGWKHLGFSICVCT